MKAGHPFLSEDLDELRATQRKILRSLNVERTNTGPLAELEHAGDAAFAERSLRLETQAIIEGAADAQAWFALLEYQRRMAVGELLRDTAALHRGVDPVVDPIIDDIDEMPAPAELAPGDAKRIAQLLVWADLLADDGYRDPRIDD